MKKMQSVMTIRLPEEDLEAVKIISKETKKDKSASVRDLLKMGRTYFAISSYSEGKMSIGKAAEIAEVSISEMIDLLAKLGIKNTIGLDDYVEGSKSLKKIFN